MTTLNQLYALTIPEIQQIFLSVMQNAVDRAMLDEMVKAIENNDPEALFQASGFTPAILGPIVDRIEQVYQQSAEIQVNQWPNRIRTPFGNTIVPIFNMRNEWVEQDLRRYSSNFITNITQDTKDAVRIALEAGMSRGDNPRRVALDIVGRINPVSKKREGGIIGLSSNQVRWVNNAVIYLQTLDEKYLSLGLRDKRFDKTVIKAIQSGTPLDQDTISKLTTAYKKNALKYRGEMVARTETMQSINRGEYASLQTGIEEGYFTERQITAYWDDSGDGRVRPSHRYLAEKYNASNPIKWGDSFVTARGERLRYPGDTSLGASAGEVIMCRCRARHKVDFLLPFTEQNDG